MRFGNQEPGDPDDFYVRKSIKNVIGEPWKSNIAQHKYPLPHSFVFRFSRPRQCMMYVRIASNAELNTDCIDILCWKVQIIATAMFYYLIVLLANLEIVFNNPIAISSNDLSLSSIEVQDSLFISNDPNESDHIDCSIDTSVDNLSFQQINLDRRSHVQCPANPTRLENPLEQPKHESTGTGILRKKKCTDPNRSRHLTCGGREVTEPDAEWILFVTNCEEGKSHPWRILRVSSSSSSTAYRSIACRSPTRDRLASGMARSYMAADRPRCPILLRRIH